MSEQEVAKSVGLIHERISAMMADVDAIKKNQNNKAQGFKFRGIDDVYNAVHPILAKHKVYITTKVLKHERTAIETSGGRTMNHVIVECEFRFRTTDGSFVKSVMPGEAADMGDKCVSKAVSMAYKYALFQLLCIPTEETAKDADSETFVVPPPQKQLLDQILSNLEKAPSLVKLDNWEQAGIARLAGAPQSYLQLVADHAEKRRAVLKRETGKGPAEEPRPTGAGGN